MIARVLKWLGICAAVPVVMLVALYLALAASVHGKTERRIHDALAAHYAPATVEVLEREDWDFGQGDFSFGGEICFAIVVRDRSGRSVRKVAMVADGDDGGAFAFAREYPSFERCTGDFFRG